MGGSFGFLSWRRRLACGLRYVVSYRMRFRGDSDALSTRIKSRWRIWMGFACELDPSSSAMLAGDWQAGAFDPAISCVPLRLDSWRRCDYDVRLRSHRRPWVSAGCCDAV